MRILLGSSVCLRRKAKILGHSRTTIARKLAFLGEQDLRWLKRQMTASEAKPLAEIQFDELETFEHTKMKPLSVPLAVDAKTRRILAFDVCRMPAKGPLAERSRSKYGIRKNERPNALSQMMKALKPWVGPKTVLRSDSHPYYPPAVRRHFPKAQHLQEESRSGCITGQGELKEGRWDPLFSINHTCAMLRANVSRLIRRTWCTTKKPLALKHHVAIYVRLHNEVLIQAPSTAKWAS